MQEDNLVINSLWIGKKLSPLELLTLNSFIEHGHTFYLWVYEDLDNELPEGVVLKNANEIVPASEIFKKKEADPIHKHGKNSLAFFADIFRAKLLYEKGGWWVDMDVLCLKPFNFKEPYFFRSHPYFPAVNNIIKCPKGAVFMQHTYKQLKEIITETTKNYLLPNQIFNQQIKNFELTVFIKKDLGNLDWWPDVEGYLYTSQTPPNQWYFIHWVNEEWRTRDLNKYCIYAHATLASYLLKYQIEVRLLPKDWPYYWWYLTHTSFYLKLKSILKRSPFYPVFQKLNSKYSMSK